VGDHRLYDKTAGKDAQVSVEQSLVTLWFIVDNFGDELREMRLYSTGP